MKSKSDCSMKISLCKSDLSEIRTVYAADSISLSPNIDILLYCSLWWDRRDGEMGEKGVQYDVLH